MIEKPLKPEIFISSFDSKDVQDYITQINEIGHAFGPDQGILLHIDSFGGECYGLIMLLEHLKSIDNPIVTYTTSKAMSCGAFLLSIAGNKGLRFASPHSTILVHEVQGGTYGDMKEMETSMVHFTAINEKILTLFAKAIGLKNAKDVRALIKSRSVGHDLNLTAQEAKELGVIDEVAYIKLESSMTFNLLVEPEKTAKKPEAARKQPAKGKKK